MIAGGVLALLATAGELARPFPVEAGGAPIDVEGGHAAPFLHDVDGDGLSDLFVGQFGDGRLRLHRNSGSRGAPRFEPAQLVRAGDVEASVPYG